jgi:hypothetical protein
MTAGGWHTPTPKSGSGVAYPLRRQQRVGPLFSVGLGAAPLLSKGADFAFFAPSAAPLLPPR